MVGKTYKVQEWGGRCHRRRKSTPQGGWPSFTNKRRENYKKTRLEQESGMKNERKWTTNHSPPCRRRPPPLSPENVKKTKRVSVGTSRSAGFHCSMSNPLDFATFNGRKVVKRWRKLVWVCVYGRRRWNGEEKGRVRRIWSIRKEGKRTKEVFGWMK